MVRAACAFLRYSYGIEYQGIQDTVVLTLFAGAFTYWSHEKAARLVFATSLNEKEHAVLTVNNKAEAELAHLQGTFIYQIGELYL
jgi:hypothetical protein